MIVSEDALAGASTAFTSVVITELANMFTVNNKVMHNLNSLNTYHLNHLLPI
ncbi:hypothetical protein [Latilactobacillus sakei]|uniref:hypothetical protein n=1 Tax=Latilactobacillus sakei TaxID=1599 RepID=UPI000334E657|nr:hypothetical protein [Latilactobacillus sakei]EOR85781.1 hypothetical protein LS25_0235 [Latilactobacillus sakei subsp. sakei LS25]SON70479.1 conserved protein of unknown function [Latilactobacillus sakei]